MSVAIIVWALSGGTKTKTETTMKYVCVLFSILHMNARQDMTAAASIVIALSCAGASGSALHRAAEAGDAKALAEALARGEDPLGRDKDNYTPLHLAAGCRAKGRELSRRDSAREVGHEGGKRGWGIGVGQ
jgi:hypothetical protein